MGDDRRLFGTRGEDVAADFLKKKGIRVLHHQYRTAVGEIDLVCREGDELVFVEVKSRRSTQYGYPEASITRQKFSHMVRAAECYLQQHHAVAAPWRLDVVAIQFFEGKEPEIVHFIAVDNPAGY